MKKKVIFLVAVLAILFVMILFSDWKNANVVASESENNLGDNITSLLIGVLIVVVVTVLILIAVGDSVF